MPALLRQTTCGSTLVTIDVASWITSNGGSEPALVALMFHVKRERGYTEERPGEGRRIFAPSLRHQGLRRCDVPSSGFLQKSDARTWKDRPVGEPKDSQWTRAPAGPAGLRSRLPR